MRWASVNSSTLCSASLHNVGQKSPFISSDSRHLQQIRLNYVLVTAARPKTELSLGLQATSDCDD